MFNKLIRNHCKTVIYSKVMRVLVSDVAMETRVTVVRMRIETASYFNF